MGAFEIILAVIIILLLVLMVILLRGKKQPTTDEALKLYTRALNHMLRNEDEEALKCFSDLVKKDTNNIDAYLKLGILLRKLGKGQKAAKVHQGLLIRQNLTKEQKMEIFRNLVEDYVSIGEVSRALTFAESILSLEKKSVWAYEKLWELHSDLSHWDKAAEFMKKVHQIRGESNFRLLALYKVQEGLEKFNVSAYHDARLIFRKAIKIDPECEAPYYYMAESYVKDNRKGEAIEWWEKFAAAAPEKAHIIFNSVQQVLFELGNFGEIETFYKQILFKNPGDIHAIAALADFYERKGNLGEAVNLVEDALGKTPESLTAKIALAKLLISQGKYGDAREVINEFLEKEREKKEFICRNCGHKEQNVIWLCPACGKTDTFFD